VARDERGEGGVGAFAGVALEELMIAHGGWLQVSRRRGENPTGNFWRVEGGSDGRRNGEKGER
jgi:hypothetical protein